jgi:hypothetical protein
MTEKLAPETTQYAGVIANATTVAMPAKPNKARNRHRHLPSNREPVLSLVPRDAKRPST